MKRNIISGIWVAAIIVMFCSNAVAASTIIVYGEEAYINQPYEEIRVKFPTDVWFVDIGGGVTEFPILIDVHAFSSDYYWNRNVPSKIEVNVWAQYAGTKASWLGSIHDRTVLGSALGTHYTTTYTAGVSGKWGDDKISYSVGMEVGLSWTGTTSTIQTNRYYQGNVRSTSTFYDLGKVVIDFAEQGTWSQVDSSIVFLVKIPNLGAATREGYQMRFKVETKIYWSFWGSWPFYLNRFYTDNTNHVWTTIIGDNQPTTDIGLYLLEATDWSSWQG